MLSTRLQSLKPSATLAMSQKSAELQAQGIDIINMSVGEPDFNTPDHIKAAGKKAIDDNITRYSPVPGYPGLRKAIQNRIKEDHGLDYAIDQIIVSNGAKQSITNAILTLINPGDEVLIPAPYWVSYSQMVLLAEGTPIELYAGIEQDFKITPDQLQKAITPRTKLLLLNSPCNPTGTVYSKSELEALAEIIRSHDDILILSDEIYEKITYCGKVTSIAELPGMQERTIIVNGVSKAYAMTGWRIGYIAAPQWIAKGCNILQSQYTSGPGSISQKAAEAAFAQDQSCCEEMRKAFEKRRDLITRLAKEIPGLESNTPEGAFYLFPKCSSFFGKTLKGHKISNATDFVMYLLEVAHVACVSGDAFGAPEYFRMSYALSDERITEALTRIKNALEQN
ncbi:MAG: pyridoxal phosphate-dependent aminotransferase [Bacteroidales bacterium]|nr:pyridoxal phosphate-dependent aminotransferase [Bacteroidales bacterium]